MTDATLLWSIWQALLQSFTWAFTRPGHRRFVEWVTALALNVEEHPVTQSVLALGRPADWRALERFAEYGRWDTAAVTRRLARLIEKAPGHLWHGYHVSAVDGTKVHRNSPDVWGTCTFKEYTARCPNRASTVRAHNWVVTGALLPQAGQPWLFLPAAGRLYFRDSQLPGAHNGPPVVFRTKCQLLVEMLRGHAKACPGKNLGVFDGAFAVASVVRPLVRPDDPALPRIDFVTRLRHDAVLHALPPVQRQPGQRGPMPKWGKRLAPPRQG